MAQAKNKTVANKASVSSFISEIENIDRKKDTKTLLGLMKKITSEKAVMWGGSIIGFGTYHYKYDSGREGDFMKVGFSPRKNAMTIYIMPGFARYNELMSQLGKHKIGKSCLYIKKLEDVDIDILTELIQSSYDYMTEKYG